LRRNWRNREHWEDKALAEAIESDLSRLRAMVDCDEMMATGKWPDRAAMKETP